MAVMLIRVTVNRVRYATNVFLFVVGIVFDIPGKWCLGRSTLSLM